tara:strand:- start:5088 stop:6587 length:1500 start_codon:yes stop_codon:yes gene_type:complete
MKKNISYRSKLLSLAKIYKINSIFDKTLKLTTHEIELILLKNKIQLPSGRRQFLLPFNETFSYFLLPFKKIFSFVYRFNKILKTTPDNISIFFKSIFYRDKSISRIITGVRFTNSFSFNKVSKKIFNNILIFFNSVVFNIKNFFKIIFNTIIDFFNSLYNFKADKEKLDKFVIRGAYASLVIALVYGGYFLKGIVMKNLDTFKISVEIKSEKIKEKRIAKTPEKKELKDSAKITKNYNPETDYTLKTQTVLNLFEDLEYSLDKVRDEKKVKPIYFTRLPKDLSKIKSIKAKKETFLQILLPLVVAENQRIEVDRDYLLKIIKGNNTEEKIQWLRKKYKEYKVKGENINELIEKIDIVPTSIALAQAAKESGWGTSRFALEGNAIYGQWTWDGVGIEPLGKEGNENHKILKFPILRASVKAYITNLNTHRGYKDFRAKRFMLRQANKKLEGVELIHELENYAETGKEYTKIIKQIIEQNDLHEFETVIISGVKEPSQLKL